MICWIHLILEVKDRHNPLFNFFFFSFYFYTCVSLYSEIYFIYFTYLQSFFFETTTTTKTKQVKQGSLQAVAQKCSVKNAFKKFLKIHRKTCVRIELKKELCEIFKNTYFVEHLRTVTSFHNVTF